MTDTITVTMRAELASELASVLDAEVNNADEFHSTEQTMQEAADSFRGSEGVVEMRRGLATELADVLEAEIAAADEFYSTEQTMREGAERLRSALV